MTPAPATPAASAGPDSLEQLAPLSDPLSFGDLGTPISIGDADSTLRTDAAPSSKPSSDPAPLLRPSNPTLGGGLTEQTPVDPLLLGKPERGGRRTVLLALGAAALGVLIAVVGSVMVRNKASQPLDQSAAQQAPSEAETDPAEQPASPKEGSEGASQSAADDSEGDDDEAEPSDEAEDDDTDDAPEASPAKTTAPRAAKASKRQARPKATGKAAAGKTPEPTSSGTAEPKPKDSDPFSERL